MRGCLVASDARGLRDLTLWETNDGGAVNFHTVRQARPCREVPAVLGITVAEIEKLRQDALSAWLDRAAAERERDQARAEAEELRALLGEALAFVADEDLRGRIGRAGVSRGE